MQRVILNQKYEPFLITSLDYSAGASIYFRPTTCLRIKPVKPKLLPYSICNQTDRRCLLRRVIRSFHGYLEATGRPRACTCARVPGRKAALRSGRTRGRALLSLVSCSLVLLFAPSSLVSIPINAVIRSAKSNFNWRLDKDTRRKTPCTGKKKKEKSWETPSFNGIIYTPSKHRWIMILKLSRSERIYRTNFGFRSVGRVLISITSALCGVRAITVHGSAGHRPFTAFISTFRSI